MGAAAQKTETPKARIDPPSRPIDGNTSLQLVDKEKGRFYVLVQERGVVPGEFDLDYYLSLAEGLGQHESAGYRIETKKPGGVRFRAGGVARNNGDRWTFRGMVLISCPIEFKQYLDQVGEDGSSGQRSADQRDKLYRKTGSYVNIRRPGHRAISIEQDPRNIRGDTGVTTRVDEEELAED